MFNKEKDDGDDPLLPVISYPCKWKPPQKRRESNSEAKSQIENQELHPLETFYPRPEEFQGMANDMLSQFIKNEGKGFRSDHSVYMPLAKRWANVAFLTM